MNTRAWLLGFLVPGLKEIVLVALVTLVLYGRSGLQVARRGGGIPPWLLPIRRTASSASSARANVRPDAPAAVGKSRWGDRYFWFLAIIAATAVAAWVVTRTLIVSAPELSH